MKFDTLLAQYLYQHKKLNLPGIGTFEADSTVVVPDDNDKQKSSLDGISYKSGRVLQPDEDLIDFIKVHTGKMKPLAMSDLEDYLALGKQFLNIGKPFYIEGIGTLKLNKEGKYEFSPGAYVTTKLEDPGVEKSENRMTTGYREERSRDDNSGNAIKRTLLVIGVLGSLALIGWAGYYLYSINATEEHVMVAPEPDTVVNNQDSANNSLFPDTTNTAAAINNAAPGQFKYVVERTTKNRAIRRYEDLRSFGNKVQMETSDSVNYKLFYLIPSTPADTLRIRDSLNRWYYGNNKKIRVKVE